MKLLFAILALFCAQAQATDHYICSCDTGKQVGCIAGLGISPYTVQANAANTAAQVSAFASTLPAGDRFLSCQGGALAGNINHGLIQGTVANPVVFGTYVAAWGGGGFKPINGMWQFTHGSSNAHQEGITIDGLTFDATATQQWGLLLGDGTDAVLVQNSEFRGATTGSGFQLAGDQNSAANGDYYTENIVFRNNSVHDNATFGVLLGGRNVLVEGNTYTHNGTGTQDHHMYFTGNAYVITPAAITSITADGATATMTVGAGHNIPPNQNFLITVTGATAVGFNVTSVRGVRVSATVLTYPAAVSGTASVVGAYTLSVQPLYGPLTVRNNTFTEGNIGGAGQCVGAMMTMHGHWTNILYENNSFTESLVASGNQCVGIEIDDGQYGGVEAATGFFNVVIRGNTVINAANSIGLDLIDTALVENNYIYSTFANFDATGIRLRIKSQNAITAGLETNPNKITIRYNTVYLTAPNVSSHGVGLFGNASDPLSGTGHQLYGNLVVLGSSASSTSLCFKTDNYTQAMFNVKDNNACYYLGGTVPGWNEKGGLGAQGADANKSDLNSTFAATASVTTGQPFFTSPTTSPAISTSSAAKDSGRSGACPYGSWGGFLRNQGLCDKGAYEFGATTVIPESQTGLKAQ